MTSLPYLEWVVVLGITEIVLGITVYIVVRLATAAYFRSRKESHEKL